MSDDPTYHPVDIIRRLASNSGRGRTVLTILYLCVLSLCFITPILYYLRLRCEARNNRRLREMEISEIRASMERSVMQQSDENRAACKKFHEERRARILQLFTPVRMILKPENFVDVDSTKPSVSDHERPSNQTVCLKDDVENTTNTGLSASMVENNSVELDPYFDDESVVIRIPKPGLFVEPCEERELRLAPGSCTICLSTYEVGSNVVWSSNALCEHVFHAECVESWLMKQRDGSLCPCCRRDFIIDPYDVQDDAELGAESLPQDPVDLNDAD